MLFFNENAFDNFYGKLLVIRFANIDQFERHSKFLKKKEVKNS